MEELEAAAQTVVAEGQRGVADESARELAPPRTSGTLSSSAHDERLPIVDRGLSVDPEDLGRQYLSDATHQDNFESVVVPEEEGRVETLTDEGEPTDVLAEGTVDEIPTEEVVPEEPREVGEVDLLSNTIRGGSLFDQPTRSGDTRPPHLETDESERDLPAEDEAREIEANALLNRLRHLTRRGVPGRRPPRQ